MPNILLLSLLFLWLLLFLISETTIYGRDDHFISQMGKLALRLSYLPEAMELVKGIPGLLFPNDCCLSFSRPRTNVCWMKSRKGLPPSQPFYCSKSTPHRAECQSWAQGGSHPAPCLPHWILSLPSIFHDSFFSLSLSFLPEAGPDPSKKEKASAFYLCRKSWVLSYWVFPPSDSPLLSTQHISLSGHQMWGGFSPHQAVIWTPVGCPTIVVNSNTTCLEIVFNPTG